jgi:CO/xanthine dehydrogenase FAD-binding subunit
MSGSGFVAPGTLEEALEILAEAHSRGSALPEILAGGTDLYPKWAAGAPRPGSVLSLHRLDELKGIALEDGALSVGAMCTHARIRASEVVRRASPSLAEAASEIGAVQVQNRGTLGGNVANASPAADLVPPLAAAEATLELASVRGRRRVPCGAFYLAYRRVDRAPDELLVRALVPPLPEGAIERFRKIGTRRAQAISKVVGGARLALSDRGVIAHARIALGSVGPTVVRLTALEAWLLGKSPVPEVTAMSGRLARESVSPIDDVRSTAAYRLHIVGKIVEGFVRDLCAPR